MKTLALVTLCSLLVTCEVPLGRDGEYGAVFAGYRLPETRRAVPVEDFKTVR